jgi:hypothetical protein
MENKTWATTDKSAWGDGPWQAEPDKEQWTDPDTGLPCLLKRNMFGSLCGYVGVGEGHPWFGKDRDEIDADAHGGLNYASFCEDGDEAHTICHVPAPGEPDRVYWLGFDCGHAWDFQPRLPSMSPHLPSGLFDNQVYRDADYVKAECARLAAQAKAASEEGART